MKVFKKKIAVTKYEEQNVSVTNVIHDLPTWMFPKRLLDIDNKMLCPICHQEMNMEIGHGVYVETCSYIRLNNWDVHPIHRECYDNLCEGNDFK